MSQTLAHVLLLSVAWGSSAQPPARENHNDVTPEADRSVGDGARFAVQAAKPTTSSPPRQPAPSAALVKFARAIYEDARAMPVEILADILLRRNVISLLPEEEKAGALKEVFWRAGEAREPWPLRYYDNMSTPGGRAADIVSSQSLRLDALSIRCETVQKLLKIDPKPARELFEAIPLLEIKPVCPALFVPNAAIYYETLAAVAANSAFTQEERDKQTPWTMVESGVRRAATSSEIAAAAKSLANFAKTEEQATALELALAAALGTSDSDRAFTSAVRKFAFVNTVLTARETLQKAGAPGTAILEALRGYLVRGFSSSRCGEAAAELDEHDYELEAFNDSVRGTAISPISAEELKPLAVGDKADPATYKNQADYQALMEEVTQRASGIADRLEPGLIRVHPKTEAPAMDARAQSRQVLSKVEDWRGAPDQNPLEVFYQRIRLLTAMLTAPLEPETARAAESEAIAVLDDPAIFSMAPGDWLDRFEMLYFARRARYNNAALRRKIQSSTDRPAVSDGFPDEADPGLAAMIGGTRLAALSLYARVEALQKDQQLRTPSQ